MKQRLEHIDFVRGILITLVVLGHSGFPLTSYLYWFHMAAFFLLSGSLFQTVPLPSLKSYFLTTLKKLGIPYLSNGILVLIIGVIVSMIPLSAIIPTLKNLLQGGTYLRWAHGVFWFIPTLILSRIIFALVESIKIPKILKLLVYSLMYLVAHRLSYGILPQSVIFDPWWSPRYYLLGTSYLAVGYYLKQFFQAKAKSYLPIIISLTIFLGLTLLEQSGYFNFVFDWKYGVNTMYLLDIVLPVVAVIIILGLSRYVQGYLRSLFLLLGQNSTVVMYYHIIAGATVSRLTGPNWLVFTIFGTLLPLFFKLHTLPHLIQLWYGRRVSAGQNQRE